MKYAITFTVVVVLALLQIVTAQSNTIQWGKIGPDDTLLHKEMVSKKSSFLQIVTKDITFQTGNGITCIKATDQYTNGNGGYATLLHGGVGYGDVTIHLKSQRGHGFNFIIEIYGH